MRSLLLATLLLCMLPAAPLAHGEGRAECAAVESERLGRSVPFCALLPAAYDAQPEARFPVLYFLHGLGDSEQSFLRTGAWSLVESLREDGRLGDFILVTPAGGSTFYINARDGKQPYEDFFIREFMPQIEKRYRIAAARATRAIGGISMGGYGALRFAFKYPQLFASVGVHSAALAETLPPGLLGAGAPRGGAMAGVFGSPLDQEFWRRNTPFTLARQAKGLGRLQIYFDCGREDELGFAEGAERLHQLLLSLGVKHEFHLYPGGHSWDYFARHLPASLQFHSRAFKLPQ